VNASSTSAIRRLVGQGMSCCAWLIAAALLGLVTGCNEQGRPSAGDAPASAQRVISLSPAITETVYALGQGTRLIGRSDYDLFPSVVLSLPAAGTALAPNYEQIARLRPDLILIEQTQSGFLTELSALAEVMELPWLSHEEVRQSVLSLSERFDVSIQGQQLVRQLDDALTATQHQESARVLLILDTLFDGGSIWVMKPGSLHGSALLAAGVNNAAVDLAGDNASISIEGLLSLNPDAIIVMTASTEPAHHQAIMDGVRRLTPLRAVRDNQVLLMAGSHVFRTGPSLMQFASELRQLLATIGPGSTAATVIDG